MSMVNFLKCALICFVPLCSPLAARTWKSVDGKIIKAELVKVDGDIVVLNKKGKVYRVPMSKLSEEDREFLKTAAEEKAAAASDPGTLFGVPLVPGKKVEALTPLSEKMKSIFAEGKNPHTQIKIAVHLPENFDPSQPQKLFWPVGGLNNEAEWKKGNIGKMRWSAETAVKNGYIVIAADTELGNPLNLKFDNEKDNYLFHEEVVEKMEEVWPDFRKWQHVCGGFSSGAKCAYYRVSQLRAAKVNVVGAYYGGCNQCYAADALKVTKTKKRSLKPVKAWISAGNDDGLVKEHHMDQVKKATKSAGYGKVKTARYEGKHVTDMDDFTAALTWFVEE